MSALKLFSFRSSNLLRNVAKQKQISIQTNKFLLPSAGVCNRNFSTKFVPSRQSPVLTFPLNAELRFLSANAASPFNTSSLCKYSVRAARKTRSDDIPPEETTTIVKGVKSKPPPDTPETPETTPVVEPPNADDLIFGEASKLTQFQKFKLMYKKYWYVLIPVHVVTSVSWIAGFYYLSKSGVDIPSALQTIHISETIIDKVRHSDMGHYAIAYLCYKIITPLRYAVSLGMTTVSIKRLVFAGYIKPIPTKKEFIAMYEKQKADRAKRRDDANKK